jgi:hypothetical protein
MGTGGGDAGVTRDEGIRWREKRERREIKKEENRLKKRKNIMGIKVFYIYQQLREVVSPNVSPK